MSSSSFVLRKFSSFVNTIEIHFLNNIKIYQQSCHDYKKLKFVFVGIYLRETILANMYVIRKLQLFQPSIGQLNLTIRWRMRFNDTIIYYAVLYHDTYLNYRYKKHLDSLRMIIKFVIALI